MEVTSYRPGTPSWVDLGVVDPDAAGAFYTALFGWTVLDRISESDDYRICLLRDHPVAGIGAQEHTAIPPYWSTYISVADADATTALVKDAGGQVSVPPREATGFGRMAVFADPSGAPFSVWQPRRHIGSGLVNEPGTLCWNELTTRKTEEAKSFYRTVFGWESRTQPMGGTTYTEWRLDGETVSGMMPMDERWPSRVPSHWMVYFAVADPDATAARATELGGQVSVPPTEIKPGRFAVLNDSQGAMFSILELRSSWGPPD